MALNVKSIIADTFLEVFEHKPLRKITVTDIKNQSGISRQTFYNHFHDMADLMQYIYMHRIVIHWDPKDKELDFCEHLMQDLEMTRRYQRFLKEAYSLEGQNNLKDYMVTYCILFDSQWMQTFYGEKPMPEYLKNSVIYHSGGSMHMKINWILTDMPCSIYELAETIIVNRHTGLSHLFWQDPTNTPYARAVEKIRVLLGK